MHRFFMFAMVASALLLAGCDLDDIAGSGRFTEDFHHNYPLKAGGRLSLENFNGSVEISGWSRDSVEITGTKYASTPELLDAVKIDIQAGADAIFIRTVRPMGRRGSMGAKYYIKAPHNVNLDRITSSNGSIRAIDLQGGARLRTSNGAVRAENVRGELDVQTSNGGIDVRSAEGTAVLKTTNGRIRAEEIQGSVDASTTNGGIYVRLAGSTAAGPIRLHTSNGGVELALERSPHDDIKVTTTNGGIALRLPDNLNARLDASTSNASITTEFDVRTSGQISKHRLQGTIGAGGPVIQLSTSNGGIRLLRL